MEDRQKQGRTRLKCGVIPVEFWPLAPNQTIEHGFRDSNGLYGRQKLRIRGDEYIWLGSPGSYTYFLVIK